VYTQCPYCDLAFRVMAPDLSRASGRVSCAGCSRDFNALEKLTEDPPAVAGVADDASSLLDTLNEFAGGHEIRIEDTGVEWRVIDEDEADEDFAGSSFAPPRGTTAEVERFVAGEEAEQLHAPADDPGDLTSSVRWYLDEPADEACAAADAAAQDFEHEAVIEHNHEPANGSGEEVVGYPEFSAPFELDAQRYDDNTPLPEDFVEEEEPQVFRRRAEDRAESRAPEAGEAPVDLALGEADEWMDLLDEVAQRHEAAASGDEPKAGTVLAEAPPQPAAAGAAAPPIAPSGPSLPAASGDPLAETDIGPLLADDEEPTDAGFPSDIDTQFDLQALEMGITLTGSRNLALEEEPDKQDNVREESAEGAHEEEQQQVEERAQEPAPPREREVIAAAAEAELALEGDEQDQATDITPEDQDSDEAEARRREEAFEQELAAAWTSSADEGNPAVALSDHAPVPGDHPAHATDESKPPQARGETAHHVPPQTEEEMTINMLIDQDLIRLAEQQDVFTSTRTQGRLEEAPHVETIIMEGDFVTNALEAESASGSDPNAKKGAATTERRTRIRKSGAADLPNDEDDILDAYVKTADRVRGGRRRTDPPSYRVIAGVTALALVLAAQVVHAYRDALATYPVFDRTIGSVYRLLGEPLNPDWNIKEWQFEATSGRTDEADDVLTISSRLANGSTMALPYPLLHVSLTDRREEIIGSKLLEPEDYLDANADPAARVPPGERFTAMVKVDAPSPEATGFKLNACYREPGNRVRCATEDFKE
jgi:predicted Zn finger-like uncharacterized protein